MWWFLSSSFTSITSTILLRFFAESAKDCQESIIKNRLWRTLYCSVSVTFKLLSFKYSSCVFKVGLIEYKKTNTCTYKFINAEKGVKTIQMSVIDKSWCWIFLYTITVQWESCPYQQRRHLCSISVHRVHCQDE